ncbi:MAG: hypothetical protein AAFY84_16635 [Pseudomonadota bacterium]
MKSNVLRAVIDKPRHEDGVAGIRWTNLSSNRTFDEYFLDVEQLKRATARIRQALHKLQESLNGPLSIDAPEPLQELALCGVDLYQYLMTCSARRMGHEEAAVTFRSWFETEILPNPESWRIEFVIRDVENIVPWGLVFSPRPGLDIKQLGTAFPDYEAFWCHSFNTAVFHKLPDRSRAYQTVAADKYIFSLLVEYSDQPILQLDGQSRSSELSRKKQMEKDRHEAQLDHRVFDYNEQAREFLGMYDNKTRHFLYMSLQAEADAYEHDSIRDLKEEIPDGELFLLLDGDAVIRGDRGDDWLHTLFDTDWSGLVAAETDIKNPSLHFAGWEFLEALLTHASPLHAMLHKARRDFWPASLLYGLYCDPMKLNIEDPPPEDFVRVHRALKAAMMSY